MKKNVRGCDIREILAAGVSSEACSGDRIGDM